MEVWIKPELIIDEMVLSQEFAACAMASHRDDNTSFTFVFHKNNSGGKAATLNYTFAKLRDVVDKSPKNGIITTDELAAQATIDLNHTHVYFSGLIGNGSLFTS